MGFHHLDGKECPRLECKDSVNAGVEQIRVESRERNRSRRGEQGKGNEQDSIKERISRISFQRWYER